MNMETLRAEVLDAAVDVRSPSDDELLLTDEERRRNARTQAEANAPSTRSNYASQFRIFDRWCAERGVRSLPASESIVITYLNARAEGCEIGGREHAPAKPPTLQMARAAIAKAHQLADLPNPAAGQRARDTIRALSGIHVRNGGRVRQAPALTEEVVAAIRASATRPRWGRGGALETEHHALARGLMDIAVVNVMRDGLLRRSEAARITWEDISPPEVDGSGTLQIRWSKADQLGEGSMVWLSPQTMVALAAIRNGAAPGDSVFGLSPQTISLRIRAACEAAGFAEDFSGHSPRVGMARDLARHGAGLPELMTAGRWKSSEMPARYIARELAAHGAVARYYRQR